MSESIDSSLSSIDEEQSHQPSSTSRSASLLTALIDPLKSLFAGSFGGFCSLLVGHPFDTIKVSEKLCLLFKSSDSDQTVGGQQVRLQTIPNITVGNNIQLKNNMLDCMRMTVKYEVGSIFAPLGQQTGLTTILAILNRDFSDFTKGFYQFCWVNLLTFQTEIAWS